MVGRGVTRPMGEREAREHGDDDRMTELRAHHQHTLWVYWTVIALGAWMVTAPVTFGHLDERLWVDPSGGRGVWFSDQTHTALRAWLMTASDVASGALLLLFGWRALRPNRPISLWVCCFVGVWLTFAPIVLWAPTAAGYLNASIVGALVIALTILIPGMPNMIMYMQMGEPRPRGWSYNPSSWPQRWIMIVAGFAGWLVSRYLAAYQLGYVDELWDPLFGFASDTQQVLDSNMSHMWPISDAGLGAVAYTFEFLMGWMGSQSRWRTMPWMVAFFGILVIPLGLTHILLVIAQPLVVHHWCTFCLLAALIMLPMIPLEVDEVVAMGQHMVEAKRRGDRGGSLWRIFWLGGSAEGCQPEEEGPALFDMPRRRWGVFRRSIRGMSFPPTLVATTALGVGLMAAPAVFGVDIRTVAADIAHLGGALVVTISVVCMGEVLRAGRVGASLLGIVIAAGPWLVGAPLGFAAATTAAGVAIAALALPRGRKTESYGMWDRYVR